MSVHLDGWTRPGLRCAVLLGWSLLAACGPAEEDAADAPDLGQTTDALQVTPKDRLLVYSNNIENEIFDWKDLIQWMAAQGVKPDVFLVQQVSGQAGMNRIVEAMNRILNADYAGVVAQPHPTDLRFGYQITPRPRVSTAIIYRTARLEYVKHDTWFPFGTGFAHQNHRCDVRTDNSGYQTLRVRLHDKLADKDVVAISLRHWTWSSCNEENVPELVDGLEGGSNAHPGLGAHSQLQIVGGDFNGHAFGPDGSPFCWYRVMNRSLGGEQCADHPNLGFTDPMYQHCGGDLACVRRISTIDFLFGRGPAGEAIQTRDFHVVSFREADQADVRRTGQDGLSNTVPVDGYHDVASRYSGHEARTAVFLYPPE